MRSERKHRTRQVCAALVVGCSLLAVLPAMGIAIADEAVTLDDSAAATGPGAGTGDPAEAELTDGAEAPPALPEQIAPPVDAEAQDESAAEAEVNVGSGEDAAADPAESSDAENSDAETPAAAAEPAPEPVSATRSQFIQSFLTYSVGKLAEKSSETDPTYFLDGRWIAADNNCLRCQVGPGVAAAALYATNGDPQALNLALSTFDTVVAQNVLPDGSFGPPGWGEVNRDIQTTLAANELGTAYLLLEDVLTAEQRTAWSNAVTGAADFLVINGNLAWYTNGNIVLANVLTMALAYRVSGNPIYQNYYEIALSFAVSPRQDRWPGYGWITTRAGLRADGADSAGYFTESASRSDPGFDAEYTSLSLNVATRLFLVTGDERALKMMHAMTNQLWFRINLNTWLLDTSNGTRHPEPVRAVNFDSGALEVLSVLGGRSYFWDYFGVERLRKLDWVARTDAPCAGPGTYFSYGDGPVSVLVALNPALVNRFRAVSAVTPVVKDKGPADTAVLWNQFPVTPRANCAG